MGRSPGSGVKTSVTAGAGTTPQRTRISPEREAELYEAVLDLLREAGYDALTMDAVAARSHSSKATLYRRWQGKPRLVAEALRHCKSFTFEGLDTGSLAGDLHELARRVGQAKKDAHLVRAVAPAMHRDQDLADAVREALIEPEDEALDRLLERAVARGEIPADSPARAYLPHLLVGATLARPLVEQCEADPAYLERYMDVVVLPALTHN